MLLRPCNARHNPTTEKGLAPNSCSAEVEKPQNSCSVVSLETAWGD